VAEQTSAYVPSMSDESELPWRRRCCLVGLARHGVGADRSPRPGAEDGIGADATCGILAPIEHGSE